MRTFFLCVLALASGIVATSNSTPVVDVGYAQYQGLYDPTTNTSTFFGIRYAQSPSGKYRYAFEGIWSADIIIARRPSLACAADAYEHRWGSTGDRRTRRMLSGQLWDIKD